MHASGAIQVLLDLLFNVYYKSSSETNGLIWLKIGINDHVMTHYKSYINKPAWSLIEAPMEKELFFPY